MRASIVGLLVALTGCARAASDSPTQVVASFYQARLAPRIDGAPSESELARIAPFISDTLRALLVAARELRDREAARAPDEKPPFADGDLFSSLFEGPSRFEVLSDTPGLPPDRVAVQLGSGTDTAAVSWADRAVVRSVNGRYVIDDIEFGGTWPFANIGSTRGMLESGLATPAK